MKRINSRGAENAECRAGEMQSRLVVLEEVLAHLRPDLLKQEPQMCRDRVVSQYGMPGLKEIAQAEN